MKILLTHGYFLDEDPKEKEIMKPYPPLGLLYISAYLNENGVNHLMFDSTFSNREVWKAYVLQHQPQLIAFYTNLMTKVPILELVEWLKNQEELKQTKILMGGPDVSYNWENYLQHGADFLVIGEGEQTMHHALTEIKNGGDLSKVDGLAFKDQDGQLIKNAPRIKIKKVDELPLPNREAIDLELYLDAWKSNHGKRTLNVSTQRGCPYTCQWCSTAVYGQSYRRRDPKKVVDEVEYLIERYQAEALWFVDDVFTVSHKWLKAFTDEMKKRKVKIEYECITRAERLNEEVLQMLKDTGCFRIWIGAESGSQRIIDLMKRQVDINKVREMMNMTTNMGMESGTFIMIGYPTETMHDIDLTIDYLKAANPDQFTITIAYPIKGTGLYQQIEKDIIALPDWGKSTDREIDFKRTFPRDFYTHAVRKIVNEVHYEKSLRKNGLISKRTLVPKLKSVISNIKMKTYSPNS